MGIVADYLERNVQREKNKTVFFTNPSTEAYSFEYSTGEIDGLGYPIPAEQFTVPAGATIQLPLFLAMHAALGLARKISYGERGDKGMGRDAWMPIAETLVSDENATGIKQEEKKTQGQILQEQVAQLNTQSRSPELSATTDVDFDSMSYQDLKKEASKRGIKSVGVKQIDLIAALRA